MMLSILNLAPRVVAEHGICFKFNIIVYSEIKNTLRLPYSKEYFSLFSGRKHLI